jgi:hypothetical protein
MLATSTFYPQNPYMPLRPSPLSERSANGAPRPFQFTMTTPTQSEQKPTAPQRAYKPNPIVQTRDAATKRRRDMFFKRVQKGRDDKKWDARGEQVRETARNYYAHLLNMNRFNVWTTFPSRSAGRPRRRARHRISMTAGSRKILKSSRRRCRCRTWRKQITCLRKRSARCRS